MLMIPNEIKRFVLKSYYHRCHLLYIIAFMQWRKNFAKASCYHNPLEMRKTINDLVNRIKNGVNGCKNVSSKTLEAAQLPKTFLEDFRFTVESGVNPYLINSFKTIGFKDPFPKDAMNLNGSVPDTNPKIYS